MTRRVSILIYGVVSYALFFATFLYGIGWLGNFLVPTRLDGSPTGSTAAAVAIDLALLTLFALQHSGMARPGFKAWLTRFLPAAAERSTYVLLSSVALLLVFVFWQPLGGVVWNVRNEALRAGLYALFAVGWLIVLVTTFLINHFDLFGLRQVWLYFQGKPYTTLAFTMPGPYKLVRHPLYVGWLIAFWATPTMTLSHLLFAVVTTTYILAAIQWEERDLCEAHPEYQAYRRRVPMLVPRVRRSMDAAPASAASARGS
jgi:protein-S-isoprenylcysteine O-methyltransferase Ste14